MNVVVVFGDIFDFFVIKVDVNEMILQGCDYWFYGFQYFFGIYEVEDVIKVFYCMVQFISKCFGFWILVLDFIIRIVLVVICWFIDLIQGDDNKFIQIKNCFECCMLFDLFCFVQVF